MIQEPLKRLRQEGHELESSPDYMARPSFKEGGGEGEGEERKGGSGGGREVERKKEGGEEREQGRKQTFNGWVSHYNVGAVSYLTVS